MDWAYLIAKIMQALRFSLTFLLLCIFFRRISSCINHARMTLFFFFINKHHHLLNCTASRLKKKLLKTILTIGFVVSFLCIFYFKLQIEIPNDFSYSLFHCLSVCLFLFLFCYCRLFLYFINKTFT